MSDDTCDGCRGARELAMSDHVTTSCTGTVWYADRTEGSPAVW